MKARAQLPVRLGGLVLAACAALAVTAPPALAGVSQTQTQTQPRPKRLKPGQLVRAACRP